MTTSTTTLGQAIIAARKKKGISQKDLAAAVQKEDGSGSISPQYLNDIEHGLIVEALARSGGTVSQAARLLGLRRTTLVEKMRRFGLSGNETL